jgi:hypothetical protein
VFNSSAQQKPFSNEGQMKKKDTVVQINYLKDSSLYYHKLQYGRNYRYELINVNKFVYKKTEGKQEGTNFNTDMPDILKSIKLPAFATKKVSPKDEEKSNNIIQSSYTQEQTHEGDESNIKECTCEDPDKLIKENKLINAFYTKMNAISNRIDSQKGKFITYKEINNELELLFFDTKKSWSAIEVKKIQTVQNNTGITIPSFDIDQQLSNYYYTLLVNTTENKDSVKLFYEQIATFLTKKKDCLIKDSLILFQQSRCIKPCPYTNDLKVLDSLRKCLTRIDKKIAELNDGFKEIEEIVNKMQEVKDEKKITAVQKNYDLLNRENFTLIIDEFKAEKDLHEIIFSTEAEEPLVLETKQKRTIRVQAVTVGGVKVDFSTGAFINFGKNDFIGPEYYYEKYQDTLQVIKEVERTRNLLLSIGALMHVYIRMNSYMKPALSFGVSSSVSFETLNFHTGISFLFGKPGKANRFIVSAGLTAREVSLLDKRFKLNVPDKNYPETVPTSNNFPLWGGFFAVTYNFFKK